MAVDTKDTPFMVASSFVLRYPNVNYVCSVGARRSDVG